LKSKAVIKKDSDVSDFPPVGKGKGTAAINAGHPLVDAGLRPRGSRSPQPLPIRGMKQAMTGS
jgi:hypothetical protein